MAELELTPEQRMVVDDRGGSLLVSAAAGSGKTKVLVDRLFRYVREDHANVDDFLIITYTKAAAAELRGKIATELSRRIAEAPEDTHLRGQLLRVYQADIKTVDAFCAGLLRENTHLLAREEDRRSLSPDFRTLDEEEARSMGVNTTALRLVVILCATVLTAASVSVSGMIGWVGLVIPHLSRKLVGSDCRRLLPASMLLGAIFLLLVDNVSRNLLAVEIPIGILTAFIGAPFFIYLMTRKEHVL